jgi:hypothetical protein
MAKWVESSLVEINGLNQPKDNNQMGTTRWTCSMIHNGKQMVCRAPRAHGKGTKMHGKDLAVRFSSGRTEKGAQ